MRFLCKYIRVWNDRRFLSLDVSSMASNMLGNAMKVGPRSYSE